MNTLISQNIIKLSVPIPFPLHDVNMYALVSKDGWVLVDCAIGTPDARAALSTGLCLAGLHIDKLQAIVLTHHHPDHVGLSGELQEQSGARVYMHPIDEALLQQSWSRNAAPPSTAENELFFSQHDVPGMQQAHDQQGLNRLRSIIHVPPHEAFTLIEDGQEIELAHELYQVVWVPGHSDGQISLFRQRDGVFLSADHVLPRVTPNIGLYSSQNRENPLGDYLQSLAKVAHLPASIVLPGHGDAFPHLTERVAEIIAHHEQRLQQILLLLAEQPQHAYQLTDSLFGARLQNNQARHMAVAEVLAHLEYLRFQGLLERQHTETESILYTTVRGKH